MKTFSILFALLLSLNALQAGEGIDFMTNNYKDAVSKAQDEQKLMLLNFTASWCFPCKKMAKEVFPDKELGEFVHDHFVPFKVNADYFWGMDIADEFNVKAYPTILIVDMNGKVVKRIVGYQSIEKLMAHLQPFSDFEQLFTAD